MSEDVRQVTTVKAEGRLLISLTLRKRCAAVQGTLQVEQGRMFRRSLSPSTHLQDAPHPADDMLPARQSGAEGRPGPRGPGRSAAGRNRHGRRLYPPC
jgi:hypothetical protein